MIGCTLAGLLVATAVPAVELYTEMVLEPVFQTQVWIVEAGLGNERTVVLVHGLGDAGHRDWLPQIEALAPTWHVVTVDLPGFGCSEHQNLRYTPRLYAAFLQWLVDHSVESERFSLVGHSMGGAIALRYAATFPRRLERLVLLDVAGVLHRAAFTRFHAINKINSLLDEHPGTRSRIGKLTSGLIHRMNPPMEPATILGSPGLRQRLLGGEPNLIAALGLIEEDFSRLVPRVQVPTLLIWGEQDEVAPPRVGLLLESQIPGAVLQTLPGVGHVPMLEAPELTNQLLLNALEDQVPQPPETGSPPAPASASLPVARCHDDHGLVLTGTFQRVEIDHCSKTRLHHLQTEELIITASQVELTSCELSGARSPLVIRDSEVVATDLRVWGHTAVVVEDSKLDLAGARLIGRETAVRSDGTSHLLLSLCWLQSAQPGFLLGSFVHDVIKLKRGEQL